jgi:hypothetical protein
VLSGYVVLHLRSHTHTHTQLPSHARGSSAPAYTGAPAYTDTARILGTSALEILLLLTSDAQWMAGHGDVHAKGGHFFFERLVQPLSDFLVDYFGVSSCCTTGGLSVHTPGPFDSFLGKKAVRQALSILVQVTYTHTHTHTHTYIYIYIIAYIYV